MACPGFVGVSLLPFPKHVNRQLDPFIFKLGGKMSPNTNGTPQPGTKRLQVKLCGSSSL